MLPLQLAPLPPESFCCCWVKPLLPLPLRPIGRCDRRFAVSESNRVTVRWVRECSEMQRVIEIQNTKLLHNPLPYELPMAGMQDKRCTAAQCPNIC